MAKKYKNDFKVMLVELLKSGRKFAYFSLVFVISILIVLFAFTAFTQMYEFINRDECEYQEYFKNREWNGKIVDKYLDKENHA